jgi:aminoglycoside phosphotransferase family enzyme/predicted kinase
MFPSLSSHETLIKALLSPSCYDHPVEHIERVETHISWVLLTGDYVYKIKKPVDFGFLDFSTLERRKHFCEEELRLNQRLAPELYLDVVPIGGSAEAPRLYASASILEYAVKMRQFPQSQQLDQVLARGELRPQQLDAVAILLADFHRSIESSGQDSDYGDPGHVYHPVQENFQQIRQHLPELDQPDELGEVEQWSRTSFEQIRERIGRRKQDGFVRECHGDLHLTNLAWFHDKPLVFDCIEFNPDLYWIDVINDMAFLVMDLQDRGQWSLAYRLLNVYLQRTGDYEGITVLKFYLVYRAMVLSKVNAIRLAQASGDAQLAQQTIDEFSNYLHLAVRYVRHRQPALIITRGVSASGKSVVTGELLEHLGGVRIRSDVERKRLHGIDPDEQASADLDAGIYSAEATRHTYDRLHELAGLIMDAGWPVIVDAAFLRRHERERFRQLAREKSAPYVVLDFKAPADVLRQRIRQRQNDVSDAGIEVLERQLVTQEPLLDDEQSCHIPVDTRADVDIELLVEEIMNSTGLNRQLDNHEIGSSIATETNPEDK